MRMSAATRGNGHRHQMKVTDWEMYLRVTHVLLNLIVIYTRYFVMQCLMVWVPGT
jgi:hypothetical protein